MASVVGCRRPLWSRRHASHPSREAGVDFVTLRVLLLRWSRGTVNCENQEMRQQSVSGGNHVEIICGQDLATTAIDQNNRIDRVSTSDIRN
eukprot:scaffold10934_cov83-Skeletonema_dohrnii-CCMP3373.AAC.4